ncbi:MAG: lipopolysaccharide biosynthesis protein, partial [Vicinamibacterales bacterium]
VSTAVLLWPFGFQMILGVVYSRLAVFTVERWTTRAELGVFSVAVALHGALLLVPASLALLHFPELTRRTHAGDETGVRHILVRYTIVSAIGVTLGVAMLALLMTPVSVLFKVPRSLAPLVVTFAALAFLTIFSTMAGFLMQARGHESMAARLSVVTLLLALVYQAAALTTFGLWGIVAGAAAAELTTIALFGVALRHLRVAYPLAERR